MGVTQSEYVLVLDLRRQISIDILYLANLQIVPAHTDRMWLGTPLSFLASQLCGSSDPQRCGNTLELHRLQGDRGLLCGTSLEIRNRVATVKFRAPWRVVKFYKVTYIYIYVCVCVYVSVCQTHMFRYTYAYTYMYRYMYMVHITVCIQYVQYNNMHCNVIILYIYIYCIVLLVWYTSLFESLPRYPESHIQSRPQMSLYSILAHRG